LSWGSIGSYVFDRLIGPNRLEGGKQFDYAEHPILNLYTKQQYKGYEPKEYELEIDYHASFCFPEDEIAKLYALAPSSPNSLVPLPLFLGSGEVLARVVVVGITEKYKKLFPNGQILEVTIALKVREFL